MATETAAEQNIPTLDSLSEIFSSIFSSLSFAGRRISGDDVSRSALNGIESSLHLLAAEINALANYDIDQYNELAERFNSLEMTHGLTLHALRKANEEAEKHEEQLQEMKEGTEQIVREEQNRAQEAINEAMRQAHKWETGYRAQESQVTALRATNATQLIELKNLRQMEPDKLKKKLFDEKKKTSELTAINKTLQSKYNIAQRDVVSLKGRCADIEARNHVLSQDMAEMRARMDLVDGEHCVHGIKFTSPLNPYFVFYPHIFMFALSVSIATANDHDGIRFINNLDFHVMVRNTIGIENTYRVSELGVPLTRIPAELQDHWPEGMEEFLYEFHLDQIERTNPLLHERCIWARNFSVMDIEALPMKAREILVANEIENFAILGSTYAHQLEKIKGIGPETITKIQHTVRHLINQWNKEHGEPETERKDLPTRQKIMDRRVADMTKEKLKEINAEFPSDAA